MKNVKFNKEILKRIGVVGLSLTMTLSGYMFGKVSDSSKIEESDLGVTTNKETNEFVPNLNDNDLLYIQEHINTDNGEKVITRIVSPENTSVNTGSDISIYDEDSSVDMPNLVDEVYVYTKFIIDENGELQYAGEVYSKEPPVESEVVIYKYDHSYVNIKEKEKVKSI